MKRLSAVIVAAMVCQVAIGGVCPIGKDGKAACAAVDSAVKAKVEEATLTTGALAALIRARAEVVVLDARTGKYDDGRRIPGAKSLSSSATPEQASDVIPAKDSLVVTYCASTKCPASARLAARLRDLGYTNVVEYPDGIAGWSAAGEKVVPKAGS